MYEIQVQPLGWEDPPGKGNGSPLQYSCLENPMDRGSLQAAVHGVTECQTQVSDFHKFNWVLNDQDLLGPHHQ